MFYLVLIFHHVYNALLKTKKDTAGDLRFFMFGILLILIFISFIVFSLSNIFSPSDIKNMREINSDALSYSANVTKKIVSLLTFPY